MKNITLLTIRLGLLITAGSVIPVSAQDGDSGGVDYEQRLRKLARIVLHRKPGRLRDGQRYVKKHVPENVSYGVFTDILREELTRGRAVEAAQQKHVITPAEHLTAEQADQYDKSLEEKYRYMLVLPDNYDPAQAYPLVVGLHGRMGDPDGDYFWMRWCVKKGKAKNKTIMIVSRGDRSGSHNAAGVAAAIRKTLEETSAHPQAVLLMSYSNAGKSGIELLQKDKGLFSGYYVYASHVPDQGLIEDMPAYFACGTQDSIFYDSMSQQTPELADKHRDLTWDAIKGQNHSFESGYFANRVFPWFEKRTIPFDEFSDSFSLKGAKSFTEGCSFVRVMPGDNAPEFRIKGRIRDKTRLELEIKPQTAVRDLRVYLPENLFDVKGRLTIDVNGTEYKYKLDEQPKAWLALETAAYYREIDRICGRAWTWSRARRAEH